MSSTELAERPVEILLPGSPEQVKAAMTAYLETTRAALDDGDWQGMPGKQGSFIKKSGWQKIAKAYAISTQVVSATVERNAEGEAQRAAVIVRASAPNGQFREATGYCDRAEQRFATSGGRSKLENDLRNTAATRAENRAISNLAGLGAVSAEEAAEHPTDAIVVEPPEWALPGEASDADLTLALDEILRRTGIDGEVSGDLAKRLTAATTRQCAGTVPVCIEQLVRYLALAITTPTDPAPAAAQEATA